MLLPESALTPALSPVPGWIVNDFDRAVVDVTVLTSNGNISNSILDDFPLPAPLHWTLEGNTLLVRTNDFYYRAQPGNSVRARIFLHGLPD